MSRPLTLRPDPGSHHPERRVPRTAMVMAAGLGTRMRPLTASLPKPLVQVAGKALIDHVLDHLRAAGIGRVVVNVHYLADAIEAHLATHARDLDIAISDERGELLETGGGLAHALPLLGDAPFLCLNSDNLWIDGPADAIRLLAAQWDDRRMDAALLLVPYARATNHEGQGDFHLDRAGRITRRRQHGRVAPFVFTGVQILSPRLIADWPAGPFSTMIFWERAIAAGRAFGAVHQGLWFDVGTPGAIPRTEALLAEG